MTALRAGQKVRVVIEGQIDYALGMSAYPVVKNAQGDVLLAVGALREAVSVEIIEQQPTEDELAVELAEYGTAEPE